MTVVRPCLDRHARGIAVAHFIRPSIAPVLLVMLCLLPGASGGQLSSQPTRSQSQSNITTPTGFTPASVSLSGRVVNAATGLPVPRALVRFNQRAMLTDHEGRFQFDQVTESSINLQAVKPGFSMTNDPADPGGQSFQISQLTAPVEIRLYPESLLTGTITSPDGAPLGQISVIARRSMFDESGHRWSQAGQSQTDRHGDFRIPVPAGDYKLETRYAGRNVGSSDAILPVSLPSAGDAQIIHLRPGQEQHFDIQPPVRRTYPVSIAIESHGDRGIPSVTAHASDGTTFIVPASRGPEQSQSQATFNLPTGTYTLTARVQTRDLNETAETSITVTNRNSATSEPSGAVLRFVSTPVIPVELSIDPDATSDNTTSSSASTSTVQSSTFNSNTSTTTSFSTQNTPNINQLGLGLMRIDPTSEDEPSLIPISTPRNGTATFAPPAGTYRLVSRALGHWYIRSASYGTTDLIRDSITVSSGTAGSTIRLVVTNLTGSLRGTVELNGVPSSAWIYLIPDSPGLPSIITAHSGSNGSLDNPNLPPGTYRAIAFERRHFVDFADPQAMAPFASYFHTVTITSGAASSVTLNAVPQLDAEAHP